MKTNLRLVIATLVCFFTLNLTSFAQDWHFNPPGNVVTGAEYFGANGGAFPLDFKHFSIAQPMNFWTTPPTLILPILQMQLDPLGNLILLNNPIAGVGTSYQIFDPVSVANQPVLWFNQDPSSIFVGVNAGNAGMTGPLLNTFVGYNAGTSNTTGTENTFIGNIAGQNNTQASANVFVGNKSGIHNIGNSSSSNTFVGHASGEFNTIGANNTFLGESSGINNLIGIDNVFVGFNSGVSNTIGKQNTIVGDNADVCPTCAGLIDAVAIGYKAIVETKNTMILGGDGPDAVNVGIGMSGALFPLGPQAKLDVENDQSFITAMPIAGLFNNFGNSSFPSTSAVQGNDDITSNNDNYGGQFEASYSASINFGISGTATTSTNSPIENIGVYGQARKCATNNYGVVGDATSGTGVNNAGGVFSATGLDPTPGATNFGVYAAADNARANNFGVFSQVDLSTIPLFPSPANIAIYGHAAYLNPPIPTITNSWAGYFDGNVMINGQGWVPSAVWILSDQQFKTQIDSITNATSIIKQLKPRSFFLDTTNIYGINFTKKQQMGFIAQDVELILPALVTQQHKPAMVDSLGNIVKPGVTFKALNYEEFIPLLTRGIQEQSKIIDSSNTASKKAIDSLKATNTSLQNQINTLTNLINSCCNANNNHAPINNNGNGNGNNNDKSNTSFIDVTLQDGQSIVLSSLSQNDPNPYSENTTINFFLTDDVQKAEMLFYNAGGKLIQSVELNQRGNGAVSVYAADLSKGMYSYTLVIDGKIFATKKMVKQ